MEDNGVTARKRQKVDDDVLGSKQLYSSTDNVKISFAKDFPRSNVKLIEVSQNLLKSIQNDTNMKIVGCDIGEAVFCTSSRTFSVKKVETSNSVFVVGSSSNENFHISTKISSYLELYPIKGRVEQIKDILRDGTYLGLQNDQNVDHSKLLSRTELESIILASGEEIKMAMKKYHVVEISGKMRLLTLNMFYESIRIIIDAIIENNWSISRLSYGLMKRIPELDTIYLDHILDVYGEMDKENSWWSIPFETVCKLVAHRLFRYDKKSWDSDEFMTAWSLRIPGVENPSERLLEGIALKDVTKGSSAIYKYCPVDHLSTDLKMRFAELFEIKQKLSRDELEPYFKDFHGELGQPKSFEELSIPYIRRVEDCFVLK